MTTLRAEKYQNTSKINFPTSIPFESLRHIRGPIMQHVLVTRLRASFNPKAKIKEGSLRFAGVHRNYRLSWTVLKSITRSLSSFSRVERLRYQRRRSNLAYCTVRSVIYRERISPLLLLPRTLSRDTLVSRAATTRRIYTRVARLKVL